MTTFITASFKVDLSNLNITFSEENSFFENDLIKQYSVPFKIPRERSYIPFFEFISSYNSTESNRYVKGTLFRNDKYYEAELLVLNISESIEVIIYYSFEKVLIFDKKLNTLAFPNIIVGDDIHSFAKETIAKNYPETKINFVEIYDPEKYKDPDYGVYKGYINYNEDGEFIEYLNELSDYQTDFDTAFKYGFFTYVFNEIRPFVYLKEVMKFIFQQINYTIIGDFMTDDSFNKCLLYNGKSIFYTNNNLSIKKKLDLTYDSPNLEIRNRNYNLYVHRILIDSYGVYKFTINLDGTSKESSKLSLSTYFNDEYIGFFRSPLYAANNDIDSDSFSRTLENSFTVPKNRVGKYLEIRIICNSEVRNTLKGNFEITGTSKPLYLNNFSLKDIMPDITVGEFINKVKDTFNMSSTFNNSTKVVEFNFFDTTVKKTPIIDLSDYSVDSVSRKLNKSTGYKISFSNEELININKKGDSVDSEIGFTEKKISIEPLPIVSVENKITVKHQEGLSMLFFQSNPNAKALTRGLDYSVVD